LVDGTFAAVVAVLSNMVGSKLKTVPPVAKRLSKLVVIGSGPLL
jgi:hypothetical protein